jgi:hypothetical protein
MDALALLPGILSAIIILVFPLLAIIAGWFTGKPVLAVVLGACPFPLLILAGIFLQGSPLPGDWIQDAVFYYGVLAIIGGLAGFLASGRTVKKLALSLVLAFLWIFVMISGIN